MAEQNKDNLRKLLRFLDAEIIHKPENRWFVDELRSALPRGAVVESGACSSSVKKIEKYLALDYKLDHAQAALDYSSIKDDYLRQCFEADCREMLRFRFGLRGHCIDFGEFCRFAQIQAERLLNMYYSSKGTLPEIKAYIKKYNEEAAWIDNGKTLEDISYSVKLWAFTHEYKLQSLFRTLDNVRKVRNTHSHGSTSSADEQFFQSHYAMLVEAGYPLQPSCLVDWQALKKDKSKNEIYFNTIRYTPEHKRYIDLCWQRCQPFDEVIKALEELILQVTAHTN